MAIKNQYRISGTKVFDKILKYGDVNFQNHIQNHVQNSHLAATRQKYQWRNVLLFFWVHVPLVSMFLEFGMNRKNRRGYLGTED